MILKFTNLLSKVAKAINEIIEHVVTIALIGLFLMILVEVFSRYIFRLSTPWISEAVGFSIAFIAFWGSSCLVYRRSLLAITFIRDRYSPLVSILFDIVAWVLFMYYIRLFIQYGLSFAVNVQGQLTPSQVFRLSHVRLIIPSGGALIFFQCFNNFVQDLVKLVSFVRQVPATRSTISTK